MGAIGWSAYEYYTADPYDVFAAMEGYYDKMDELARISRVASYRLHQSLVSKPLKIEDYMPIFGDKKVMIERLVMDKEMYEKIKLKNGLN